MGDRALDQQESIKKYDAESLDTERACEFLETRIIHISEHTLEDEAVSEVCSILRRGGIVALPTETVYGLAANALDEEAVKKIFVAKGRPQDNPLIVHIAEFEMLPSLVREIPESAERLTRRYWPGPLTVVLKKSDRIPLTTSAGLDTVGVRMPSHPVIREIIRRSGLPLAAPSANLSGSPSTTTAQHCIDDLYGRVDAIVASSPSSVGLESTVISLCTPVPRLLRPGGITYEQLCEVLGEVELDPAVLGRADPKSRVSAPGMKYKHYAPKAKVWLLRGDSDAYCRYVNSHAAPGCAALCFEEEQEKLTVPCCTVGSEGDPQVMARELFAALRDFDRKGAKTVFAHCPELTGLGMAVYNRLVRAAAFDVIEL